MTRKIILAIFVALIVLRSIAIAGGISGERGATYQTPAGDGAPPTYCASTNGTVSTGTAVGVITSIIYLFHPATEPKRYKIRYGEIHGRAGKDGTYLIRITAITAENATPGGTLQPALPFIGTNPASNAIVRTGAAAPTRAAGDYFTDSKASTIDPDLHLESIPGFQVITLLPNVASGIELRTEITELMTTAAGVAAWICWTED